MGSELAELGAQDSCRLDWLSLSYAADSRSVQKAQIEYWVNLLTFIQGTPRMAPGGGRRFFEESWTSDAGIQIKWTEPEGEGVNKGLLSVDLKGTAFLYLPAHTRTAIYLDAAEIEGFKQCTRMDVQRTVVNPHATAEEIYRKVLNREVWVKGFAGYGQEAKIDRFGNPIDGCTITWGNRKGTTRLITYNKQAEMKFVGDPAVRHEMCLRKQPARDRFVSLIEELQLEGETEDTVAESAFVKANLNQSMTYLDTSRLKHLPEGSWPKNWARDSQPADFWEQVVTGEAKEYQTRWRFDVALERAMANKNKQYGRLEAKYIFKRVWVDGESLMDVKQDGLDQAFIRLKDEDIDEILMYVPDDRKEEALRWAKSCRATSSKNIERVPLDEVAEPPVL